MDKRDFSTNATSAAPVQALKQLFTDAEGDGRPRLRVVYGGTSGRSQRPTEQNRPQPGQNARKLAALAELEQLFAR